MTNWTAIVVLSAIAGMLFVLAGWLLTRRRRSRAERERSRRLFLSTRGRVTEAEVTEVRGAHIGYSYEVNSVTYHAVQDVEVFADLLPPDSGRLLGPAIIRYASRNPANSILISEDWSGIRIARPATTLQTRGEIIVLCKSTGFDTFSSRPA